VFITSGSNVDHYVAINVELSSLLGRHGVRRSVRAQRATQEMDWRKRHCLQFARYAGFRKEGQVEEKRERTEMQPVTQPVLQSMTVNGIGKCLG
jgi:hypothetical protein